MQAKLSNDFPPNLELLQQHFPYIKDHQGWYVTVGGIIYNPFNLVMTPDYVAHELVHVYQQHSHEGGPDAYLKKYIEDMDFRLEVETVAYGYQLQYIRKHEGYQAAQRRLIMLARHMASPLYGPMVTYENAARAIFSQSLQTLPFELPTL